MFLDTAIGYPGSMHTTLEYYGKVIFSEKPRMAIFSVLTQPFVTVKGVNVRLIRRWSIPSSTLVVKALSDQCNTQPLSSARSTVERAFAILKGRQWKIPLKRVDSSFYNVSEIILTCSISQNFCQEAREDFSDDEVLQRIIAIGREYLQTRDYQNIAQNPLAQDIRQSIEQHLL